MIYEMYQFCGGGDDGGGLAPGGGGPSKRMYSISGSRSSAGKAPSILYFKVESLMKKRVGSLRKKSAMNEAREYGQKCERSSFLGRRERSEQHTLVS